MTEQLPRCRTCAKAMFAVPVMSVPAAATSTRETGAATKMSPDVQVVKV